QERLLRRGGRSGGQRAEARRPRRDPAREGHRPEPLLPGRGRPLHVGRPGVELPAVGPPGRLPARPAGGPRGGAAPAAPALGDVCRGPGGLGAGPRCPAAGRPRPLPAALPPLLSPAPLGRGAGPVHRAHARARGPGDLPLPAASPVSDGEAVRRSARRLPGHRARQRAAPPAPPLRRAPPWPASPPDPPPPPPPSPA